MLVSVSGVSHAQGWREYINRTDQFIVNLPGKPTAIRQCLDAVFPAIPYCLDLIGAAYMENDPTVIEVFRPKKS